MCLLRHKCFTFVIMISSAAFKALNLSDFCVLEVVEQASGYEYLDSYWQGEVFGFSASLQLEDNAASKCLILDLSNKADALGERVLQALELDIAKGDKLPHITGILGEPIAKHQFVKDRTTYEFSTRFDVPYSISCTIHNSKGLIFISLINA